MPKPNRAELNKKWWHRLFKVIFVIATILFFIIAIVFSFGSIEEKSFNTYYVRLVDYTKAHPEFSNVLIKFNEIPGQLGCLDESMGEYEYITINSFDGYCNANLLENFDDAWEYLTMIFGPLRDYADEYGAKARFKQKVGSERLVCLIEERDRDYCDYENIVKHTPNNIYYIQGIFYALITTAIWVGFWLLIYYKGLLYIVYGSHKENNNENK